MSKELYSEKHLAALTQVYGQGEHFDTALQVRTAPLEHGNQNADIRYLDIGNPTDRAAFFVPGFTEGIRAKAAFGLKYAEQIGRIIMPDQHRFGLHKDLNGQRSATHSQALNNMSVIGESGLSHTPGMTVVAHSFGAPIFASMVEIAGHRNWTCFQGSDVVFTAPAETGIKEVAHVFAMRFKNSLSGESGTEKTFPDPDKSLFIAGAKNMFKNFPRSVREVWEMKTQEIDYERLMNSGIGRLLILGFRDDTLFSPGVLSGRMDDILETGVSYSVPVAYKQTEDGVGIDQSLATHNDDQFSPGRSVGAIKDFLASK